MRRMKIRNGILSLTLIIGLIIETGCSNKSFEKNSAVIRYVKTITVEDKESVVSETFPGVLKESDEVKLSFRIAGPIDKLPVKEGQFIKKGELLAQIDTRDYKLQYEATLAEYEQVIGEVERLENLYEKKNLTDNDYDKAISGKKQITVKLNATKNALNDTRLVAPFDGYVQTVFVNNGEITDAGMPVVSIVNSSSLKVETAISPGIYIKKDHISEFYCTNSNYNGQKFPLTLLGINSKTGINKLYKMSFLLESSKDFVLAPGMNVEVHFSYDADEKKEISIPINACFEKDNATYVYTYESGQAVLTKVKVGMVSRNNNIIILEGLQAGDIVITAGHSQISNTQKVKLLTLKY
jgi:RND family efflux transporter MFP subunit